MIRLFVGLGNPGPAYEATRHNAGFWWVEGLARQLKATLVMERAYQGLVARANGAGPQGAPVWLLQPMTFMNLSGRSVAALARFYKIEPQQILVVHDELDLLPGQARLKLGGSHAGHNGLKDIHAQLGSADYWRLRLGIGHPGVKAEVADYVLRKPPAHEREGIEQVIDKSLAAAPLLMHGPMDKALARIHAQPPRPKPPRPPAPPTVPAVPSVAVVPALQPLQPTREDGAGALARQGAQEPHDPPDPPAPHDDRGAAR